VASRDEDGTATHCIGDTDDRGGGSIVSDGRGGGLAEHLARADLQRKLFGTDVPPIRVGRYVLVRELGTGGVGVVFVGRDPELDREVAIKLLRVGHGRNEDLTSREARMLREAQALARLAHPNVVAIYDVGTYVAPDEWPLASLTPRRGLFLAMELVDGEDMAQWIEQPRTQAAILEVFVAAGRGLAAAHAAGLVHRDFKPSNVLVARADGRVRVADFGLARAFGAVDSEVIARDLLVEESRLDDRTITSTGWVLGTPVYMAPEQHAGEDADARSDQYSFCVALWEALFGARPFAGRTPDELAASKRAGRLAMPRGDVAVPAEIRAALVRGLATNRDDRHPSMIALLEALVPSAPRRWPLVLGVGATIGAVALVAWPRALADPCADLGDAESIAGASIRTRIADAIGRTQVSYASTAAAHVDAALATFAERWTDAHASICTGVPEPAARTCLRDDLGAAAAFVAVMTNADVAVMERAAANAAALPDPRRCIEAAPNVATASIDTPAVRDVRDELARVAATTAAGRVDEALAGAIAALAHAEATNDPGLVALAQLQHGNALAEHGDWAAAEKADAAAYWTATENGHDAIAADAALQTATAILEGAARPDEAETWLEHADAALARAHGDTLQQARHASAHAILHYKRGAFATATEHARRAQALFLEVLPADDLRVVTATGNLAAYLTTIGAAAEAEPLQRDVLERRRAALGETHPDVAQAQNILAVVLVGTNRLAEAEPLLRSAIDHWEAALGPNHPLLAMPYNNLGLVDESLGRTDDAIVAMLRSIEIRERALGAEHPDVLQTRANLAAIYVTAGRAADGEREARAALDPLQAQLGDAHLGTALARMSLGMALLAQDRAAAALAQLDPAITTLESTAEAGLLQRARTWRAGALVELGRGSEAIEPLEGILAKAGVTTGLDQAFARLWLARALQSTGGDPRRVTALVDAALAASRDDALGMSATQRAAVDVRIASLRATP